MNEPNEPASGLPTYPMPRTAFHYPPELARLRDASRGPCDTAEAPSDGGLFVDRSGCHGDQRFPRRDGRKRSQRTVFAKLGSPGEASDVGTTENDPPTVQQLPEVDESA